MSDHIIDFLKEGSMPHRALKVSPECAARLENQAMLAGVSFAQAAIFVCWHFEGCKAKTDAGLRRRLRFMNIRKGD